MVDARSRSSSRSSGSLILLRIFALSAPHRTSHRFVSPSFNTLTRFRMLKTSQLSTHTTLFLVETSKRVEFLSENRCFPLLLRFYSLFVILQHQNALRPDDKAYMVDVEYYRDNTIIFRKTFTTLFAEK